MEIYFLLLFPYCLISLASSVIRLLFNQLLQQEDPVLLFRYGCPCKYHCLKIRRRRAPFKIPLHKINTVMLLACTVTIDQLDVSGAIGHEITDVNLSLHVNLMYGAFVIKCTLIPERTCLLV